MPIKRSLFLAVCLLLASCGKKTTPTPEVTDLSGQSGPKLVSPLEEGSVPDLESLEDLPTTNRPTGWDSMSPAEKASFKQLAEEIRAALDRTQATDEEWATMTQAERRALMGKRKETIAEMSKKFDDAGYELDQNAPRQIVNRAIGSGGGAAPPAPNPAFQIAALGAGTIQYDTGTVFGTAGVASQMIGNRFDSAVNTVGTSCCFTVGSSGTITMITFHMVNTWFGSVVWSLFSDISGTMAMRVTSIGRSGVMTGLNTLSVMTPTTANAYMNTTFLAGIWQFDPSMTGLAVDTGTTGGQGFHAISLNDGGVGTGLTTVTTGGMGLNAIFRVTGQNLVPVELMKFEAETTGDEADASPIAADPSEL